MTVLSDFFSIPAFIYLGITIVILALASIFFLQKLNAQNHKISSMVGLVTTMAEEMNFIRGHLRQASFVENRIPQNAGFQSNTATLDKRIVVSDDEEDSESESDEDSDSDDEEDEEEEEDEDENVIVSPIRIEISESNNVRVINMSEKFDIQYDQLEEQLLGEEEEEDLEEDDLEEYTLEDIAEESQEDVENQPEQTVKSIQIDYLTTPFNAEKNEEIVELSNNEILKTINISSLEDKPVDIQDYKKMSIGKLRHVIVEKGLATDASKLNKHKILELLGFE